MNIEVQTTHIEMTPAISEYIDKHMKKLDRFISPQDTSALARVEIGTITRGQQSGEIFRAEINLHVAGKDLRSVSEKDDLYTAIIEARDDLVRSLKKYQDKKRSLVKRGGQKIKSIIRGFRR